MDRITKRPNGNYQWDCPIDKDYHRESGRKGLLGVLILCVAVFSIFLFVSHGNESRDDLWIPLLVIGVILAVTLLLLSLWNSAGDPHERYEMCDDYVRSGYGKSSIYSVFKKTGEVVITEKYIEMIGKYPNNRIYVPPEDMDFVREYILDRIPDNAVIRRT